MHNALGHAVDLLYDGVQIEYLPPNTTSLIQPMDQGIIRAFKPVYTHNALQHLAEAVDSDQDVLLKTYWRKYTIASCLLNIQRPIQEIKNETLNACWKKLWPEMVRDPKGCSPDDLHHSAVDTAVNLAKQLGGDGFNDMTPDDINALIDAPHNRQQAASEEEEEDKEDDASVEEEDEVGLTLDHLATMVRMANELRRVAQEWDPLMFRSLQFSNIIEVACQCIRTFSPRKKGVPAIPHNHVPHSEKDPNNQAFCGKQR